MCLLRTMGEEKYNRDLLFRIAGLLGVGLIGLIVMVCGLALAFGSYRLSTFLFVPVVVLLVMIKVVARSK